MLDLTKSMFKQLKISYLRQELKQLKSNLVINIKLKGEKNGKNICEKAELKP